MLAEKARAEFHKMEMGDPDNIALWKWFVQISLEEYQKTYRQLDITFDSYKGESFYTDKMPAQVQKLRDKGLLKLDDGASIVDLSAYDMPPCLILKRDGSTLYPTRDIAAAVYRKQEYHFDKCIYVTSAQQILHFRQWFKVVELMGYDWYDELVHVPYGTVSVNGAKLATRTGNVVLLRDLFGAAIEKVTEIMETKNPALKGRTDVAEAVGVGAIVFYYLSNNRIKDNNNKEVTLTKNVTASATLDAGTTDAQLKNLADGMYIPSGKAFADDVAGNAADNIIFKFTGKGTYTLKIQNSESKAEVYSETSSNLTSSGGHYFYITTKATDSAQNAGIGTYKKAAFAAGNYTFSITDASSNVVLSGSFTIA